MGLKSYKARHFAVWWSLIGADDIKKGGRSAAALWSFMDRDACASLRAKAGAKVSQMGWSSVGKAIVTGVIRLVIGAFIVGMVVAGVGGWIVSIG